MASTITTQGFHKKEQAPEKGVVSIAAGFQGPKKAAVSQKTLELSERIRANLALLSQDVLTTYSVDAVQTWAESPWNRDGKQLPLVYSAVSSISATFSDFEALSSLVAQLSECEGVAIQRISWELTTETSEWLLGEARAEAVRYARRAAENYATAAGMVVKEVVQIADAGMLQASVPSIRAGIDMSEGGALVGGGMSGSTPELRPKPIVVQAVVDCVFSAE